MSVSYETLGRWKAENDALPQNASGHIISPRYLPPESPYRAEWGQWCRQHPRSVWPEWLKGDVDLMKPKKSRHRA